MTHRRFLLSLSLPAEGETNSPVIKRRRPLPVIASAAWQSPRLIINNPCDCSAVPSLHSGLRLTVSVCNSDESVSLGASITPMVIECPAMIGGVTHLFEPGRGLMDSGRAGCLKMIIAELIQGAKTKRGVDVMKDLADALPPLAGWHLIVPVEEGGQEYIG